MSDYADTMTSDCFADLMTAVERLAVEQVAARREMARIGRAVQTLGSRIESIEQSIEVPQTVDTKGAARLLGVSVDTVRRDKSLRRLALTGAGPLRWKRSTILEEINRRAAR